MLAKQSTAKTIIVGPILDSAGVEYASAVIGDLSISKNGGTLTAMAAAATLTIIANGQYTLVMTTGNMDTLGTAQISCNKATYQMPLKELDVLPATVYDALVTNATTAVGGLGDIQRITGDATATANLAASALGIIPGAFEGTPSTTILQTDLAEATDDHYIGRTMVITSGAGAGQATVVIDYTGTTGTLTVSPALITAPAVAELFVLV